VILIKNIYTLWGRKRFHLPVTYFPTSLVYPFTLLTTVLAGKISVIIEKLLRSTDVKRIYILLRPKRGENVKGRFETWKQDQVGASEGST